jgi:HTH-type transcriptional regulator/antitoxin HigA
MDIRPIKTEADYSAAFKEIEALMGTEINSPEGDRLDVLVTLVEAYERTHYPMDFPIPSKPSGFAWSNRA